MHETNKDFVKKYAQMGWQVFPVWGIREENGKLSCYCAGQKNCKAGKHPWASVVPRGHLDATTDDKLINEWFKGSAVNVGINTAGSGLIVLDIDVSNGKQGLQWLQHMKNKGNEMPLTPTAKTGSGGMHYYFNADSKTAIETLELLDGHTQSVFGCVDVIHNTALIVPPSKHISGGTYEWIVPPETPLAEIPEWFQHEVFDVELEKIKQSVATTATTQPATTLEQLMTGKPICNSFDKLEDLPAGSRNDKINSVIGSMLAAGYAAEDILQQGIQWVERQSPQYDIGRLREKIAYFSKKELLKQEEEEDYADDGIAELTAAIKLAEQQQQNVVVVQQNDQQQNVVVVPVLQHNNTTPVQQITDEAITDKLFSEATDQPHLIGLIGDTIEQIAEQTEADPKGILIAILTAFGSVVGHQPFIWIGARKHHANIFSVIHGKTGTLKGEPMHICKALMGDVEWQKECIKKGLGSGEGLIELVRDAGATADGKMIPGVSDKRLMVVDSEFSKLLKLCRRNDSTLSPLILNAWDGDVLQIANRKQTALCSTEHHISILGNITTDELRTTLLKGSEGFNGFANRFLWIGVERSKIIPFPTALQYGDLPQRWEKTIQKAKAIGEMQIDESFRSYFTSIVNDLVSDAEDESLSVNALERSRPYVYRLSMIYALIDGTYLITERHLKAAYAVWRMNAESCRQLFSKTANEALPLTQRILQVVREKGKCSKSDINLAFHRNLKAVERDEAIQQLISNNLLERSIGERNVEYFMAV